ncbi:hypothetical protein P7K49_024390 [Saguinus oedipus]|uniref:Uncharacterized protein n=1 Tax=Saguinus oedipus TaxID=9490 RepID=A0ABQ9UPC5_SAGOE|nr:hypothetical protein P7K49_024390 [Saguinus oedipus]
MCLWRTAGQHHPHHHHHCYPFCDQYPHDHQQPPPPQHTTIGELMEEPSGILIQHEGDPQWEGQKEGDELPRSPEENVQELRPLQQPWTLQTPAPLETVFPACV